MFTRRLKLCKCWKVSCAGKVAFQEGGALGFYSQNGTRCSLGKRCWQQGAARVHSSSRSHSLYNVLSYCSRQRFSWRNGSICRVHKLSIPPGCSQQPSDISPCVALASANQSKQWCETGSTAFSILSLETWVTGDFREKVKRANPAGAGVGVCLGTHVGHGPAKHKRPNQTGEERLWSWVWFTPDESQHTSPGNFRGAKPSLCSWESGPFVFRSVIIIKDVVRQQRVQRNQDWEKHFRVILALVFMFIFLWLRLFK